MFQLPEHKNRALRGVAQLQAPGRHRPASKLSGSAFDKGFILKGNGEKGPKMQDVERNFQEAGKHAETRKGGRIFTGGSRFRLSKADAHAPGANPAV